MNRRSFLSSSLAVAATLPMTAGAETKTGTARRLGLSIASYSIRWRNRGKPQESWQDALDVLDHCANELGAGCVQIGVSGWENDFAGRVRDRREQLGLVLEGQIGLPKDDGDVERFARQVKQARETGAKILRTVCLGGRRYESFKTLEDWQAFRDHSMKRLTLAEPVMRREAMILAVENHKDWRTDEFLDILRHFDSEHIMVNFDFGNNLALLEDPHEVAEALAPWIRTTHLKDMGVQMRDQGDGFLLSEVPLGEGILDLPKLVATCRRHAPDVQFNLEMITRDPLVVACLGNGYWTTLPDVPGSDLARTMNRVRTAASDSLPTIGDKNSAEQIAFEEHNNLASFRHATETALL